MEEFKEKLDGQYAENSEAVLNRNPDWKFPQQIGRILGSVSLPPPLTKKIILFSDWLEN